MKKLLIMSAMLMFTSCASIVHGTYQKVKITSESNQVITIYDEQGKEIATAKGILETKIKRGSNTTFKGASYSIKTSKETIDVTPKANIGAFVVGNLFTPIGAWGHLIDALNGAMWDLETNVNQNISDLKIK